MLKTLLVATLITFGLTAFAHDGGVDDPNDPSHTPSVCADATGTVCAHIKFLSPITTSSEGEFIVHVTTADQSLATDLKVSLWMNMGGHSHGSAPVEIAAMDEANHFKVTNAWFVMKGPWDVQIEANVKGQSYKLTIPVLVAE